MKETRKFIDAVAQHKKFLIYDTETSGLNKDLDEIIEWSAICYAYVDGKYQQIDQLEVFIRPSFEISQESINVHGHTNEFLSQFKYEKEMFPVIKEFLTKYSDAVLMGYNQKRFDDEMMKSLCFRVRDKIPEFTDEIDVFDMVKENIFEKKRNLQTMHEKLCPGIEVKYHDSSGDIRATWNVAVALYKKCIKEISKPKHKITYVKHNWYEPGQGKKYMFVTVKDPDTGKFAQTYYDFYYKCWKGKDGYDISDIDLEDLERQISEVVDVKF